jgi:hypothetical protein
LKRKIILIFNSGLIFLIFTFPFPTLSRLYEIPYEWPEADPEDYGFITSSLETAISGAENMPFTKFHIW